MNLSLQMLCPIGLILLSNILYNICAKSTPDKANACLMLTVTYLTAAMASFIAFICQVNGGLGDKGVIGELKNLNWTAPVLGLVIVGLELGYILAFRAGWKVSAASVVANIALAICLLAVGYFLYGEQITVKQCLGVLICLGGLVLLSH